MTSCDFISSRLAMFRHFHLARAGLGGRLMSKFTRIFPVLECPTNSRKATFEPQSRLYWCKECIKISRVCRPMYLRKRSNSKVTKLSAATPYVIAIAGKVVCLDGQKCPSYFRKVPSYFRNRQFMNRQGLLPSIRLRRQRLLRDLRNHRRRGLVRESLR